MFKNYIRFTVLFTIIICVTMFIIGILALSKQSYIPVFADFFSVNKNKISTVSQKEKNYTKKQQIENLEVLNEKNLKSNSSKIEESEVISIAAAGDINLGRTVGAKIDSAGGDYSKPFSDIEKVFKSRDIVFANLELPLTNSNESLDENGKIVLKSSPKAVNGLKYAGFNMLSIANNHIMDFYDQGLKDTIKTLETSKISYVGAGKNCKEARKPAFFEKNGLKIAFLAYTEMAEIVFKGTPFIKFAAGESSYGVASFKLEDIVFDVKAAKKDADIVLVSLHWGVEYVYNLREDQQEIAHKIIDSGADGILGHHPHRMKGVEIYKGKPIIYSMGNLIFDQNDPENQQAFIFSMNFEKTGLKSLEAIPIRTIEKSKVSLLDKVEGQFLLKKEKELCEQLNTTVEIENNILKFKI